MHSPIHKPRLFPPSLNLFFFPSSFPKHTASSIKHLFQNRPSNLLFSAFNLLVSSVPFQNLSQTKDKMDDLIGLDLDAPSSPTPQAKATNFLIDFNLDSISSPAPIPAAPVLATIVPASNSSSVVDAKDAASAWEACLAASQDETKYPLVPVIEGPFSKGPSDEFEEMLKAKKKGNHNFGTHSSFYSFPFPPISTYSISPFFTTKILVFESISSDH